MQMTPSAPSQLLVLFPHSYVFRGVTLHGYYQWVDTGERSKGRDVTCELTLVAADDLQARRRSHPDLSAP